MKPTDGGAAVVSHGLVTYGYLLGQPFSLLVCCSTPLFESVGSFVLMSGKLGLTVRISPNSNPLCNCSFSGPTGT